MPCARAVYGFEGQSPYELNFSAGVSIQLLRRVDENWLEGKLEDKVGIFPATHVSIQVGSPSGCHDYVNPSSYSLCLMIAVVAHENALASSGKPYAVALHTFQGTQSGDLSFSKGDLVELLGTIISGWLKGRLDNAIGIFPGIVLQPGLVTASIFPTAASFVEILRYPDKDVAEGVGLKTADTATDIGDGTRPVPKPRLPRTKDTDAETTADNTSSLVTASNLIPSRSAPAPPSNSNFSTKDSSLPKPPSKQQYGTLPKPKPRTHARRNSSNRVDVLESELAVSTGSGRKGHNDC